MLPKGFQDRVALAEVDLPLWREVLRAAGAPWDDAYGQLTHDALLEYLTQAAPSDALLDALEAIDELGSEAGRHAIRTAAADQGLDLSGSDDLAAREFACGLWLRSRTEPVCKQVLSRGRLALGEVGQHRPHREYAGKSPIRRTFDRTAFQAAIASRFADEGKVPAVDIVAYERDGRTILEVLRADPRRKTVEIRDGKPSILNFRPAASDHIWIEPDSGRVGIATRSPSLLPTYRELLGLHLAGDGEFFASEYICSLRPLQQQGRRLFRRLPAAIRGVDVTELRWRRGGTDHMILRGRDVFSILDDVGAQLSEGELIEARLSLDLAGTGRRGIVSIKVPNRIDVSVGRYEDVVYALLDELGLRGNFDDERRLLTLWDCFGEQMPESQWRRVFGRDFDQLLGDGILRPVELAGAIHPQHPAAGQSLEVHALSPDTLVGVAADPAIKLRTLTKSDVLGYELDEGRVVASIARELALDGAQQQIVPGLWSAGVWTAGGLHR